MAMVSLVAYTVQNDALMHELEIDALHALIINMNVTAILSLQ